MEFDTFKNIIQRRCDEDEQFQVIEFIMTGYRNMFIVGCSVGCLITAIILFIGSFIIKS